MRVLRLIRTRRHGEASATRRTRLGMRKRLGVLVMVALLSVSALVASTAQATSARARTVVGVYISAPTWLGNCANSKLGGSVKSLWVQVTAPSVGYGAYSYADYGDDIVWAKVVLNVDNTIVAQPKCYGWWGSRPGAPSMNTIRPTRNGQTWWVGPLGTRHN